MHLCSREDFPHEAWTLGIHVGGRDFDDDHSTVTDMGREEM